MQPRPSAETSRPWVPSLRVSIRLLLRSSVAYLAVWLSGRPGLRGDLAQSSHYPAAVPGKLALEAVDLVAAAADQRELAIEVAQRLLEDLAPANRVLHAVVPLARSAARALLGGGELAQLVERDAEQLLAGRSSSCSRSTSAWS